MLFNLIGPEINDRIPYVGAATNFTVSSSPSPPQGTYYLDSNGAATPEADIYPTNLPIITSDYSWLTIHSFRLETTGLSEGGTFGIIKWAPTGAFLGAVPVDYLAGVVQSGGTTFKIGLYDQGDNQLALTSSTYPCATDTMIRLSFDPDRVHLEVNGVPEFEYTTDDGVQPSQSSLILPPATIGGSTIQRLWRGIALWASDSKRDRPEPNIEVFAHHPNGNQKTDEWGSHANCADTSGDYTHWDDWNAGGANDGATTYNCESDVGTFREVSTTTNATYSKPVRAVKVYSLARYSSGSKSHTIGYPIRDGTNEQVPASPQLVSSTTFDRFYQTCQTAPPGGVAGDVWTQSQMDNLEIGAERYNSGANMEVTALSAEGVAADVLGYKNVQLI